jgi:hypothetical protein
LHRTRASLGTWRTAQVEAGVVGLIVAAVCIGLHRSRRVEPRAKDVDEERAEAAPGRAAPLAGFERVVLAAIPFTVFFTLAALPNTLIPVIGSAELGLGASVIGLVLGAGGASRFVGPR